MRNYCVVHVLLFVLFMLVYQCASAQDYVVTVKGDTIRGEIKPLTFGPEKKVQVTDATKRKQLFSILQTRSFVMKGETYQPVRLDVGYVYMKLVKPGYMSLYAFQAQGQTMFDSQYLLKRDGTGAEVPNLTFRKVMARLTEDCPDVSLRITQGEMSKRDLDKIVDEYNQCIENRTTERKVSATQVAAQTKKMNPWDELEQKLNASTNFEGKETSLEMVTEIKNKISRGEKVPNFIVAGLRESMAKSDLKDLLETAIKELQ